MTFSIIIPIYNVEKYLNQCIDSVLIQKFTDYEIILVNDGSPDNCGKICDDYAKQYPQIKVIHKENGGLSDARNFGIKSAKGDYLIFLDSDDYWEGGGILSDLAEIINNDNNPDIIIHGNTFIFETGENKKALIKNMYNSNNFISDYENLVTEGIYYASAWNKIVRRELIYNNNINFPKGLLHEDVAWSFDIAQHIKNYTIYESSFYQYRIGRKDSITNKIKDINLISYLNILTDKTNYLIRNYKSNPHLLKGNIKYLAKVYLFTFRDYYKSLNKKHQKNVKPHFSKMKKIDYIYKDWFINYLNGRKFKLLIKIFGIQTGMELIKIYYKYIHNKNIEI